VSNCHIQDDGEGYEQRALIMQGEIQHVDIYRLCGDIFHLDDIDVLVFQVVEQGLMGRYINVVTMPVSIALLV
jgi:hypothetical protein